MKTLQTPNSICWNITQRCNEKCKFCYRDKLSKDLTLEENMKILENMLQSGVKKITFAGGEPLLYPGIFELIRYAHEHGAITSLTTNGILVTEEVLDQLDGILDWFTLSLDGPNSEVQVNMTRHKGHFDNVTRILSRMQEKGMQTKVKINTVVSGVNQAEVIKMVPFMWQYRVKRWKLFQFVPLRGDATLHQEAFMVTDDAYEKVLEDIRMELKAKNLEEIMTASSRAAIENSYFVVFPNGDVRLSDDLSDTHIGNLLQDSVDKLWEVNHFNKNLHIQRTKRAINIAKEGA